MYRSRVIADDNIYRYIRIYQYCKNGRTIIAEKSSKVCFIFVARSTLRRERKEKETNKIWEHSELTWNRHKRLLQLHQLLVCGWRIVCWLVHRNTTLISSRALVSHHTRVRLQTRINEKKMFCKLLQLWWGLVYMVLVDLLMY